MQHQAVARTHHSTATITFRSYDDYDVYLVWYFRKCPGRIVSLVNEDKEDDGRRFPANPRVGVHLS
eukprot:scaffold14242_cov76-Skeletonema_dohrnii-CCMP3373.AAC.2